MPRDRRPYFVLPLAAFIAVLPLIIRGCSCGHDFDFHIVNWFEAAKQFSQGTLHPRWAYTPAWNAGEPRFVFYPPLSWTIGALLGLIMPWTWTPIVYTWLALTAAGLALNHAARSFTTPNAALIAAAVYIANPYTLYTAYERTAYAELLAAAWFPFLLNAILRERITIPRIAVPVAALWLTNAPAAVMGCYALAFLALIRIATSTRNDASPSRIQLAWNTACGTLLGLGLAAFYILPAASERRFVQIAFAILPGLRPQDNFLFHHTTDADHDIVLHTASIVAVLMIGLSIAALVFLVISSRKAASDLSAPAIVSEIPDTARSTISPAQLTLTLAALALAIAFMLTPLSALLWQYLPELRFLQFPWRLIAVLAAVFALSLAIALSRLSLKPKPTTIAALLAAAALTIPAYGYFHQRCYPEDTLPERLAIFQSTNPGTDPTDEYTPNTADNDALVQNNPGYWLADQQSAPAPKDGSSGPAPQHLDLTSASPQALILNLRDYPAWQIKLNGSIVTTRLHRDDGLIALPLPSGASHIDITYTVLNNQRVGYLLSALSLLCITVIFVLRHRRAPLQAERTPLPR